MQQQKPNASHAAHVGLDPKADIHWVTSTDPSVKPLELFAEGKIELRYDSTPAPGAKKEDVRYLFGVGWQF